MALIVIAQDVPSKKNVIAAQLNYYNFHFNGYCSELPLDYNLAGGHIETIVSKQTRIGYTSSPTTIQNQYWITTFFPPWPGFANGTFYMIFYEELSRNITIYTCRNKTISDTSCHIRKFIENDCYFDTSTTLFNITYKFNFTNVDKKTFYEKTLLGA